MQLTPAHILGATRVIFSKWVMPNISGPNIQIDTCTIQVGRYPHLPNDLFDTEQLV